MQQTFFDAPTGLPACDCAFALVLIYLSIKSRIVGKRTLLSRVRTGHRPDRTATAAPHASGVDETLHTLWRSPKVGAFSVALGGPFLHNSVLQEGARLKAVHRVQFNLWSLEELPACDAGMD
jgi:hypothetical protein